MATVNTLVCNALFCPFFAPFLHSFFQSTQIGQWNHPTDTNSLWFEDSISCLSRYLGFPLAGLRRYDRLPQPPDAETIEGCPVVRLHDSTADVTVLLKAIFDSQFFMPYPAPTDFETISGALRLGHNYCIDYIRQRALVHFSSAYFTTLSAFDESCRPGVAPWQEPSWCVHRSVKVAAIELAREVDVLWILPFAFYSLAIGESPIRRLFPHRIHSGSHSSLGLQDELAFLEGCFEQRDTATTDIIRFLHFPIEITRCKGGSRCGYPRLRAMEDVRRDRKGPQGGDPLYLWFGTDWDRLLAVCSQAREEFWERLPGMYGLPGWDHLEKLKMDAIGRIIP
ncbi:hypothetical protein C8R44DRAFT_737989 [Mycena epipterygia]|nr:hypothetical protein C8R44DRAFT_737989 [Mycena epipterygia]